MSLIRCPRTIAMHRQIEDLARPQPALPILIGFCRDENKQQCFQHDGSTDVATLLLDNIALVHSQTVWTFQMKKNNNSKIVNSCNSEIMNHLRGFICLIHTAISLLCDGVNVRKGFSFAATQTGIQTRLTSWWHSEQQALPKCLWGPIAVSLESPLVTSKSLIFPSLLLQHHVCHTRSGCCGNLCHGNYY